jgi:hypothetical protein
MSKLLLLVLTSAFFVTQAYCASIGQLMGKLEVKETKLGIANVEVVFENNMDRIAVMTNEYGFYYSDRMPTGKYEMSVVFNNRKFVVKQVRVYDSYTSIINLPLSEASNLPDVVYLDIAPNQIAVTSNDIKLSNNNNHQPTQSLTDALSNQAGVDVRNGKLYVKGSNQVKFFIDGTPIMGQPSFQKVW